MSRKLLKTALAVLATLSATASFAGDPLWNYDDTFVEGEWKTTLSTDTLPRDMDEYSWFTFESNETTVHDDCPGSRVIVEMDPRDTDDETVLHFLFLGEK